jgi:hydrogenase nickel incorporation protein HypA/HybF
MHELSIVQSVVDLATEQLQAAGGDRVVGVTLRIGALSCVHEEALRFGFELVTKDTPLEGATLSIVNLPVKIHCSQCDMEVELPTIQQFCCPVCQTPSSDIRQGQELDLDTLEIEP